MTPLSEDDRNLIELARDAADPNEGDRARVRAALARKLGAAAGLGAAASLGSASSASAATTAATVTATASAAKLIGAAVLVSVAVGGSAAVVRHHRRAHVDRVVAASGKVTAEHGRRAPSAGPPESPPPAVAVEAAAPRPEHHPAIARPEKASPRVHAGAAAERAAEQDVEAGVRHSDRAARPPAPALADEAGLLHAAVVARRSGQPARALELFDRHALLYPQGALAEERDAGRALALADLGRTAEARAAIDAFLRARPASPLGARLRERARSLDGAGPRQAP